MKYDHSPQLAGIWIMYLRKSRQDNPDETVEEVLSKHETMLQEYAERELGHRIPEADIYREVVSGESIDERLEIKKVLARLEDPDVAGVLVMEPSRLSRGDLSDCARIIDTFRFSHSLISTPMMVYDLENKMERKFSRTNYCAETTIWSTPKRFYFAAVWLLQNAGVSCRPFRRSVSTG